MRGGLSRRRFLVQSASVAGASLGLGGLRPAEGSCGGVLRLGFVGLGDRGRQLLGTVLGLEPGTAVRFKVGALADVSPENLRRAREIVARVEAERCAAEGRAPASPPPTFRDLTALLSSGEVDAVIIATPVHLHAEQTLAALAASKHVYCEKPIARTVEECRQSLGAAIRAREKGLILQVGHQRRYNPRYEASVRYLHGGEAGKLVLVRAQWHSAGDPPRDKPWVFHSAKSGDSLLEQASHQLDVFNWLLGSHPSRACGFGGLARRDVPIPGRDTMDHYAVLLEYPCGASVQLSHVSFAVPDRRFAGIYELAFAERAGVDLSNAVVWTPDGEARHLPVAPGSETRLALEAFLRSVSTGEPPRASAEAGYEAAVAALLCCRAIEDGRTLEWEEVAPEGAPSSLA